MRHGLNGVGDPRDFAPIRAKYRVQCVCRLGNGQIGPHGPRCHHQAVSEMRVRVIRYEHTVDAVEYESADLVTGEIVTVTRPASVRRVRDYRVGYYTGGNGFLSVNDGRVTAKNIARILGGSPHDRRTDYVLVS